MNYDERAAPKYCNNVMDCCSRNPLAEILIEHIRKFDSKTRSHNQLGFRKSQFFYSPPRKASKKTKLLSETSELLYG